MNSLDKMRDRINNLKDIEMVEIAQELLSEMAEIQRLKEQIELRESKLIEGKRAAFYFFAQGMNPEELAHAAGTANGRLRFLKERAEKEKSQSESDSEESSESSKSPQIPASNFGGLGSSFKS